MEMEDHHHHHHHHSHHHHQIHLNQHGITDLRHFIASTPSRPPAASPGGGDGPAIPPPQQHPPPPPPPHHQLIPSLSPPQPSFETLMMIGRPISAVEIMPLGLHHQHQLQHQMLQHHEHHGPPAVATSSLTGGGGLDADTGGCLAGDGGTGRWPRQETLTLLEIRSRLDSKFKEANQKGPLWDEVSRIMSEEHGYQRRGKKCREKFENLYKYYKKTKEGKAGRQDGKHYRFFRQLEALYGESSNSHNNNNNHLSIVHDSNNYSLMPNNTTTTTTTNLQFHAIPRMGHDRGQEGNFINDSNNSLSLSNDSSSELESSSSDEDDNESSEKARRSGTRPRSRSWKAKIKEFIDARMRRLMEKQEAWLEKLTRTLEQKETERGLKEEEWRRREASRVDREHRFWAKERAWIEARDSALMEALKNLTGKEQPALNSALRVSYSPELGLNPSHNNNSNDDLDADADDRDGSDIDARRRSWSEQEVSRLVQLRTSMGPRWTEQGGFSEEALWEEIATKMASLGFDRSGSMCREKWESVDDDFAKKSRKKKRKENNSYGNFHTNESSTSPYNHHHHHGRFENSCDQANDGGSSSPSNNVNIGNSSSTAYHEACFPFFIGDQGAENLWENYGLKINKGGPN